MRYPETHPHLGHTLFEGEKENRSIEYVTYKEAGGVVQITNQDKNNWHDKEIQQKILHQGYKKQRPNIGNKQGLKNELSWGLPSKSIKTYNQQKKTSLTSLTETLTWLRWTHTPHAACTCQDNISSISRYYHRNGYIGWGVNSCSWQSYSEMEVWIWSRTEIHDKNEEHALHPKSLHDNGL